MIKIYGINILNHIRLVEDIIVTKNFNIKARNHEVEIENLDNDFKEKYKTFEDAINKNSKLKSYRNKIYNLIPKVLEFQFNIKGKEYYLDPDGNSFKLYGIGPDFKEFNSIEDCIKYLLKKMKK